MNTPRYAVRVFAGLLINNLVLAACFSKVYHYLAGSPREDNARGLSVALLLLTFIPAFTLLTTVLVVGVNLLRRDGEAVTMNR